MKPIHRSLVTLALLCPLALYAPSTLAGGPACEPEIHFIWHGPLYPGAGGYDYFHLEGTCLTNTVNAIELANDFFGLSGPEFERLTQADWLTAYYDGAPDRQVIDIEDDIVRDHWNDGGKYQLRLLNCTTKGGTEKCAVLLKTFLP